MLYDLTAHDDVSESGRIANMPGDVSELDDFEGEYNEVWNYNDELDLKLTFLRDPEGSSMVKIEYLLKPEAVPDNW